MANPIQPNVKLTNTSDYREHYANSVQIRVNVWDFFLVFGTLLQQSETQVEIQNFQGIYLSPQQAKALLGILQQNVGGYESAFGEIKLDPRMMPGGPVHGSGQVPVEPVPTNPSSRKFPFAYEAVLTSQRLRSAPVRRMISSKYPNKAVS